MSGRHAAPEDDYEPEGAFFEIELDTPAPAPAPPPAAPPAAPAAPATPAAPAAAQGAPTIAPVERRAPAAPGTVVADRVGYARGGRTILDDVSLRALPGQSVAVVGPSGSGKSSLLALLAGLERPDGGTVSRERPEAPLGLILQGYGLVSVLTAAENVEAPLQAGVLGKQSKAEIRSRSQAALTAVGLDHVADHLIEELSGGQQQRVAIARALAVEPAIVLADELTAELDHDWKTRVVNLVLDVAQRGGIVVLATHDMELAGRCDQVVRLVDGRVA